MKGHKQKKKGVIGPRSEWYRSKPVIMVLLAVLTTLVYAQTLYFGFTWFDDDAILLRNQSYIGNLANLPEAITRDAEFTEQNIELYRPLQNVTFMLDAAAGGFGGGMFHFTNLLIHLATVLLLFHLLTVLGITRYPAALGAALLAIHPVFTFTVCWIPARGDLLLALWSVAAFTLFVQFLQQRKTKYLWWNLAAFCLALFSKETAVMLMPLSLLWFLLTRPDRIFQRWQWIPVVGYAAVMILFVWLRSNAIADIRGGAFGLMPFFENMPVLAETLLRLFVPWPMPALPFYTLAATAGGAAVALVIGVFIIRKKQKDPLLFTGIAWFLLFNIPSMFYRPDWSDYIYDYIIHRSYLPLIGVIILLLSLVRQHEPVLLRRRVQVATGVLLVVLMVMSFSFARVFREPLPFWRYAVKTNPASSFAHKYLGGALFFNEQYVEAVASYNMSLSLRPDFTEARLNRGIALAAAGLHTEALDDFSFYLDSIPLDTMILRYKVISLMELKEYQQAIPPLVTLREQGDRSERIQYSLGVCYLLTGRYAEAKETLDSLLLINPASMAYLRVAALADMGAGFPESAIDRYLRILTVDPSANTLSNLAYAYWEKGMYREALDHFLRAEALQKENFSITVGLMLSYHSLGQRGDMQAARERAMHIKPSLELGGEGLEQLREEGYVFTGAQTRVMRMLFP